LEPRVIDVERGLRWHPSRLPDRLATGGVADGRGADIILCLFLRDHLTTERLGASAHAIKDRLHIALLCIGQNRSSPHELYTCRPALPACRWTIARALAARLCHLTD